MNLRKRKILSDKDLRRSAWSGILFMVIGGFYSVFLAEEYCPADHWNELWTVTVQVSARQETMEADDGEDAIKSLLNSELKAEGKGRKKKMFLREEPSASRLNMAFVFSEGNSEPMDSEAGKAFSILSQKDASWMAEIYRISSRSPSQMAARVGKHLRQGENPQSWGKVRVAFYNGDGIPISGYSNAKEILSLASVYAYYHDIQDGEAFLNYAQELWRSSHSYRLSVSDFYYCDGSCLDEEELEDEEAVEGAVYEEEISVLGGDGEGFLEDTYIESETDGENPELADSVGDMQGQGLSENAGEGQPQESSISEGEVAPENESPAEMIILDGAVGDGNPEPGEGMGEPAEETLSEAEENKKSEEKETTRDFTELIQRYDVEDFDSMLETADPLEASKLYRLQEAYANRKKKSTGGPGEPTASRSGENSDTTQGTGPSEKDNPTDITRSQKGTDSQESSKTTSKDSTKSRQKGTCQGHMDLTVSVYITGLKETKNLFTKDSIGNKESEWTENWQGWSEGYQACARDIEDQDWYDSYGLTVSTSMYTRNPLSASEISYYMSLIPEGTSEKRKEVIRCALQSVGRIPYYWGGKPSQAGYEGNGFGTVVSPDRRGRVLRGLDCSGWVNWVYWTALGERLPYASTSGFASGGRAVERSMMQPGDLILKTGEDSAHVCMFLGWAEDGSMYLVHETGNSTNNVTVGRYQFDWPYYRSVITD